MESSFKAHLSMWWQEFPCYGGIFECHYHMVVQMKGHVYDTLWNGWASVYSISYTLK
jgi:hypothetical protein